MEQTESFRCYYEDGTIITAVDCPEYNDGSPLIDSEFQIIEDVYAKDLPFLLIIFGLIYYFSEQKGKPK
jgi:hypothetical protein